MGWEPLRGLSPVSRSLVDEVAAVVEEEIGE